MNIYDLSKKFILKKYNQVFFVRIFSAILTLFASYYLAAYVQSEESSKYLVTLAYSNIFSAFCLFGYQNVFLKTLLANPHENAAIFSSYLIFLFVTHFFLFLIFSLLNIYLSISLLMSLLVSVKIVYSILFQKNDQLFIFSITQFGIDAIVFFIAIFAATKLQINILFIHIILMLIFVSFLTINKIHFLKINEKTIIYFLEILKKYKLVPQVFIGAVSLNFIAPFLSYAGFNSFVASANFIQRALGLLTMFNASLISANMKKIIFSIESGIKAYKSLLIFFIKRNLIFLLIYILFILLAYVIISHSNLLNIKFDSSFYTFTLLLLVSYIINILSGPVSISLQLLKNLNYQLVSSLIGFFSIFLVALFLLNYSIDWKYAPLALISFQLFKNFYCVITIYRVLK